jgi:hypothetical protein
VNNPDAMSTREAVLFLIAYLALPVMIIGLLNSLGR